MCCHQHWLHYHMMPTTLSVAPLHFLGQDNWNDMQHNFLTLWSHLHHMLPLTLASVLCDPDTISDCTIAFLRQRWNAVQGNIFGHMTPVTSHDDNGIINGTITFLMSWWLKWGPPSNDVDGIINSTTEFLRSKYQNEVKQDFCGHVTPLVLVLAVHDANSINSNTELLYVSEDFSSCFSNVVSDFLMNKINFCWRRQAFASFQTWLP